MRGIRAALLAATLFAIGIGLGPVGATPVLAADDGLAIVTKAVYTLAPKQGVVHVSVAVTATNNKPNLIVQTPNGPVPTRYFYDRATLAVQREATKVRASAGATGLSVTLKPATNYTVVDVGFAANLFFQQSTSFRLDFDLPGGAPRSAGDIRVGSAFATFYVWAFGDRGDIRIVVPTSFTVTTTGSPLDTTVVRGATNLTASGITDITNWYAVVVADRHAALTQERIDLAGGEHLVLRAWPEDKEWRRRVGNLLRKGLPALVNLVGLDWPVTGDIEIAEVHTPLLEGYAGIYHVGENRIEISEDLDELTIVHEASHAWFNSGLFVGRWIDEGFADEYASLVLDKVSNGGFKPDPAQPDGAGHVRLNGWAFPGRIANAATNLREQFGYNASWTVVRALVDEIGVDRMRAVLAATADKRIPYVGAGNPERLDGSADWRRFLDLLEGIGGSKQASALFDRWVVLDAEKPLLTARTDVRTSYTALVEAGTGWLPGIAVREPMAGWDFATARTRIQVARAILATRDRIATLASDVGVSPPAALRSAYEAATDLEPVAALADGQLAALEQLAATKTAVAGTRDIVTSVGLIGADPSAELATAVTAFGAGDTAGASAAASHAQAVIADAPSTGRTRLTAGGGIIAGGLLIAGGSAALYRRRRLDRNPVHLAAESSLGEPPPVRQAHPAEPESVAVSSPLVFGPQDVGSALPPAEPASVVAYRQRRLDRRPLPPIRDAAAAELWPPDAVPRSLPKPAAAAQRASAGAQGSAAEPKSAAGPNVGAKPKPAAKSKSAVKPKSAAKPGSAAKPKSAAKPRSAARPRSADVPDAPDPYATLAAPPADAAGQEPAAPGGEEEL